MKIAAFLFARRAPDCYIDGSSFDALKKNEEKTMGPIFGSETEYGIASADPSRVDERIADAIWRKLNKESSGLRRIFLEDRFNWWKENLRNSDGKTDEDAEVLRKLGISGEHLPNGARFYVDGSHLEYSTPECNDPWELVAAERAGEKIVLDAFEATKRELGLEADLLKRNAGRNVSYACHENYLVSRRLFGLLAGESRFSELRIMRKGMNYISLEQAIWVAHRISSQVCTGAGRVLADGVWPDNYRISQRQGFIKYFMAHDTTRHRAIVNLRDRPYADLPFARLHVICGDSNRADWSNILKFGTSALILSALENLSEHPSLAAWLDTLPCIAENPVADFLAVNGPGSFIETAHGAVRAIDLQKIMLEFARRAFEAKREPGFDWAPRLFLMWEKVLDCLERDDDALSMMLDYRIKKSVLDTAAERGKSLRALRSLEYNYHLVGDRSLFDFLLKNGKVERFVTEESVAQAMHKAPKTRARLRGRLVRFLKDTYFVSWHGLYARTGKRGNFYIAMPDPASEKFEISGRLANIQKEYGDE